MMRDELIQELAAKMGVAVDVLWGALLRQAPITGCVEIIFAVFVICAAAAMVFVTRRIHKFVSDEPDYQPMWIGVGIAWLVIFWLAMGVICSLPTTVAAFLNPDYWALNTILNAVRPHK